MAHFLTYCQKLFPDSGAMHFHLDEDFTNATMFKMLYISVESFALLDQECIVSCNLNSNSTVRVKFTVTPIVLEFQLNQLVIDLTDNDMTWTPITNTQPLRDKHIIMSAEDPDGMVIDRNMYY